MRTAILVVLMLLMPVLATSSEPTDETKPLAITAVVKVDGAAQDELYNRARLWFVETFKSANDVVQFADREAGQVVGKGVPIYEPRAPGGSVRVRGPVRFTAKVFVKEGRYKYEFADFMHEGNVAAEYGPVAFGRITSADEPSKFTQGISKKWHRARWKEIKSTIALDVVELIVSLEVAMANPAGGDDDW